MAGCALIFEEKISGTKRDRPELERPLSQLRPQETLVVCKLNRLARSTRHLLEIVEILKEKKAAFCSLGEPWADTTSHAGKMNMTVFAGIADDTTSYLTSIILDVQAEDGDRHMNKDKPIEG